MTVRRTGLGTMRLTILASLCALPLFAGETNSKGIGPNGEKFKCNTKAPAAMLDGEAPDKHEFIEAPENRATETATLADGTKIELEVAGCNGAQTTTVSLTIAKPATTPPDGAKDHAVLIAFIAKHPDALSKTPLGQPGPARALRGIDDGKLVYNAGDKLCFDKDDPAVIGSAQKCAHSLSVSWTGPSFKAATVFNFRYQLGQ